MSLTLDEAVSKFGAAAKAKLSNPAASGRPEDQLRAPIESLIRDLADLCGIPSVVAVGESSINDLSTRPDYAITVANAQVGYVELKAPSKGSDPRRFRSPHDKEQWKKLQCLPNIIYTDGNGFSLWRDGELVDTIIQLDGDVTSSGSRLKAPPQLKSLLDNFLRWVPIPPRTPMELAQTSARLCRFLRDDVAEQITNSSPSLLNLKDEWGKMLFPEATNEMFADGYAQAVTFGLLVARAKDINLQSDLDRAARQLTTTNTLIGAALRVLVLEVENNTSLTNTIATMSRVFDAVQWQAISRGNPDTWLYFYEDFLEEYDNDLRKKTGSYYTPPEVVKAMVRLVDDVLRSPERFDRPRGIAAQDVTLADPAVGTGTFILGALRQIAETIGVVNGPGAIPGEINDALGRIIAFEIQLGPFAVAQLRVLAEVVELTNAIPTTALRMYVTDTLGNPYAEIEQLPNVAAPIAESRRQANEVKKNVPITVVLGNPPYKEKAKGRGGWVENGSASTPAILNDWVPPADWGVSTHAKHLRNLYVYFWRWATWKVFDHDRSANTGIVCFITVAGFLNGPGFQKMRDYLRRKADDIWVIDCSPEGHQPKVNSRIFQGVQQPVCIVIASRHKGEENTPARIVYRALPSGNRQEKFIALGQARISDDEWVDCPSEWRAPFLPRLTGAWSTFPRLNDFFAHDEHGVMPGRQWVIAPDAESLRKRWEALVTAPKDEQEDLFHPHLSKGEPGDRHLNRVITQHLAGYEPRLTSVANDTLPVANPVRYAFRSFDRQWIIPDIRLINRPNPRLWEWHSDKQVYLTALDRTSPAAGPAVTFTELVPDLDHYKGSFGGRVFPLWSNKDALESNVRPGLVSYLGQKYNVDVSANDLFAYIAAVAGHPAFTEQFKPELVQPGLRIPLTADADLFAKAAGLGSRVIWLQTFGERYFDQAHHRPKGAPRLPRDSSPRVPLSGAIPNNPQHTPDILGYDAERKRLLIGSGFVEPVSLRVWNYEVSGKKVLQQWFSYRKATRTRPIIGDRREPSKLGEIKPDHWIADYTSDLIDLLNVLTMLTDMETSQAELLDRICSGPLISNEEMAGAVEAEPQSRQRRRPSGTDGLQTSLDELD